MATDLIRYDLLVQDALRSVVRDVLSEAAKNGLQGDHHFFITFRTNVPGLRLSNRMRTRYPEEMTIILQHQFWDLGVTDHAFEVGLSFNNVPERLLVPFSAITSFVDPSVQFGLKFEVKDEVIEQKEPANEGALPPEPVKALPGKRGLVAVEAGETAPKGLPRPDNVPAEARPAKANPSVVPKAPRKDVETVAAGPSEPAKSEDKPVDASDAKKVVSIDAFRKKP